MEELRSMSSSSPAGSVLSLIHSMCLSLWRCRVRPYRISKIGLNNICVLSWPFPFLMQWSILLVFKFKNRYVLSQYFKVTKNDIYKYHPLLQICSYSIRVILIYVYNLVLAVLEDCKLFQVLDFAISLLPSTYKLYMYILNYIKYINSSIRLNYVQCVIY